MRLASSLRSRAFTERWVVFTFSLELPPSATRPRAALTASSTNRTICSDTMMCWDDPCSSEMSDHIHACRRNPEARLPVVQCTLWHEGPDDATGVFSPQPPPRCLTDSIGQAFPRRILVEHNLGNCHGDVFLADGCPNGLHNLMTLHMQLRRSTRGELRIGIPVAPQARRLHDSAVRIRLLSRQAS